MPRVARTRTGQRRSSNAAVLMTFRLGCCGRRSGCSPLLAGYRPQVSSCWSKRAVFAPKRVKVFARRGNRTKGELVGQEHGVGVLDLDAVLFGEPLCEHGAADDP